MKSQMKFENRVELRRRKKPQWGEGVKIDSEFRNLVKTHQEQAGSAEHSVHLNRVITTAIEGFKGQAKARRFVFFADEPVEGGGTNEAPRPLEYFLAGFAFCQQVQYVKHAALRNLDITGLRMDVKGYVDQRGVLGIEDVPAGFQRIDYKVQIESSEPVGSIVELADFVESICPAHAAIKGSAPLNRTLVVNGEVTATTD